MTASKGDRWPACSAPCTRPPTTPCCCDFVTGPAAQDPQHWQPLAALLDAHCGVSQANIQRCYELVDLEAYRFLVLEDLAGGSLPQALEGDRRLLPAEVCRIIRAAAQGLDVLHRKRLAHGDVRPARFWLEQGGNVRLLRDPLEDLAPIHFLQPDPQGQLLARADYLAPDFLQLNKSADALTDLYALGCTFYQLLAGQPPFPGGDLRQKMQQHAGQPIQPLEALGIPKPVSDIVTYLMAKNPAVRFQSAAQVVVQLTPLVDPASPGEPAGSACQPGRLRSTAAAQESRCGQPGCPRPGRRSAAGRARPERPQGRPPRSRPWLRCPRPRCPPPNRRRSADSARGSRRPRPGRGKK